VTVTGFCGFREFRFLGRPMAICRTTHIRKPEIVIYSL